MFAVRFANLIFGTMKSSMKQIEEYYSQTQCLTKQKNFMSVVKFSSRSQRFQCPKMKLGKNKPKSEFFHLFLGHPKKIKGNRKDIL